MKRMKAADIVIDFTLYPRNNVDDHNVRAIADAYETEAELPPPVIDAKSKRLIDGVHRVLAKLRMDKLSEIEVIEKVYKDDAAMFLDAMRLNASHGARLDPCDRIHCVLIAERLQIPLDRVAGALHMPTEKLGELKRSRTATSTSGLSVPLKRTNQHMAGRRLNKLQVEANERSSGMNQAFYANQIIDLIEAKLLDVENENLLERLRHLHGLLEELLAVS